MTSRDWASLYAEVGRLTILWAQVESQIDGHIITLEGWSKKEGQARTKAMTYGQRTKTLVRLVKVELSGKPSSLESLSDFITRFKELRLERDETVHNLFWTDDLPEGQNFYRRRVDEDGTSGWRILNPEDIRATYLRTREVSAEFESFIITEIPDFWNREEATLRSGL